AAAGGTVRRAAGRAGRGGTARAWGPPRRKEEGGTARRAPGRTRTYSGRGGACPARPRPGARAVGEGPPAERGPGGRSPARLAGPTTTREDRGGRSPARLAGPTTTREAGRGENPCRAAHPPRYSGVIRRPPGLHLNLGPLPSPRGPSAENPVMALDPK